jgi:carbon monoxide dehydrogenase subunit G
MTRIEIDKREVHTSQQNVFDFLSDCRNYEELMPDSVTHWEATADSCTLQMKMLPKISMQISEKVPSSSVFIKGSGPFDFTLTIHIDATGEGKCQSGMVFEADINPFMKVMIEKPMGSFFGYMTKKVQEKFA